MKINYINPEVQVHRCRDSNDMAENNIAFNALFQSQMAPVDEIRDTINEYPAGYVESCVQKWVVLFL